MFIMQWSLKWLWSL